MRIRKKKNDESHNSERWLVSYADFITLLFAFFTVLYATSNQDPDKSQKFENSVKKYLIKIGNVGGGGSQMNVATEHDSAISSPLKKFPRQIEKKKRQKVESYLLDNFSDAEIKKYIKEVEETGQGIRLTLNAHTIFNKNSAKLKSGGVKVVKRLSELIQENSSQLLIESHVSQRKFSGKYSNEWELAAARSNLLARFLIKVEKVDGSRIGAVSYGAQRPLFSNRKDPRNERVELFIGTTN